MEEAVAWRKVSCRTNRPGHAQEYFQVGLESSGENRPELGRFERAAASVAGSSYNYSMLYY